MQATPKADAQSPKGGAGVRLRLEVYDALAVTKGARTVQAQAELHGVHRGHMYRIRSGKRQISLAIAMRIAADLGTTVDALFERRPS